MKVYVITAGEYSDYHICAVTLDKEKAEYLRKLHTDAWASAVIEEYDTDETSAIGELRTIYHISIGRDGTIADQCETYLPADVPFKNEYELRHIYNGYAFAAHIEAKDMERAVKIALDKRAELIAADAGIADIPMPPYLPVEPSSTFVLPDGTKVSAFDRRDIPEDKYVVSAV